MVLLLSVVPVNSHLGCPTMLAEVGVNLQTQGALKVERNMEYECHLLKNWASEKQGEKNEEGQQKNRRA